MMLALEMPAILQVAMWIAGGLTAAGVIYLKGLRPLAKFISETERSVPVLKAVTDKLHDPSLISIIVEMANQFKTDSGSSLRDVVNRLEQASVECQKSLDASKGVTDILRITLEGLKQLQDADRVQIARFLVQLDRLQQQADRNMGTMMVSSSLASDAAAGLAAGVAKDLKDSHTRASQVSGVPGESADAFSVQPPQPGSKLPPPKVEG